MTYRLLIDLQALELLVRLPRARRRRLIEQLQVIQRHPSVKSDYVDTDDRGRPVNVSIFEGLALYYWIDEADRHVKTLEVIAADGRSLG